MPRLNHKIVYNVYEGKLIQGHNFLMPIVRCFTDSMAYGDFTFTIPETVSTSPGDLTAKIYKLQSPDVGDERWIREDDDLYSSAILDFEGLLVDRTNYKITFRFRPSSLAPDDNDNYSMEFFLALNTSTISPKVIVNTKNRVL